MLSEKALRECPFCNRLPIRYRDNAITVADFGNKFRVHCGYCGAYGPESDTAEEAVKLWNGI